MTLTSPRHRRQGTPSGLQRTAGFTLIELLIVVAIIGILASIAYPSYQRYVEKSRRAEAQSVVMEVAGSLERCYTENYKYSDCAAADSLISRANENNDFYTFSLPSSGESIVKAEPKGAQIDDKCGDLGIVSNGKTTPTNCW